MASDPLQLYPYYMSHIDLDHSQPAVVPDHISVPPAPVRPNQTRAQTHSFVRPQDLHVTSHNDHGQPPEVIGYLSAAHTGPATDRDDHVPTSGSKRRQKRPVSESEGDLRLEAAKQPKGRGKPAEDWTDEDGNLNYLARAILFLRRWTPISRKQIAIVSGKAGGPRNQATIKKLEQNYAPHPHAIKNAVGRDHLAEGLKKAAAAHTGAADKSRTVHQSENAPEGLPGSSKIDDRVLEGFSVPAVTSDPETTTDLQPYVGTDQKRLLKEALAHELPTHSPETLGSLLHRLSASSHRTSASTYVSVFRHTLNNQVQAVTAASVAAPEEHFDVLRLSLILNPNLPNDDGALAAEIHRSIEGYAREEARQDAIEAYYARGLATKWPIHSATESPLIRECMRLLSGGDHAAVEAAAVDSYHRARKKVADRDTSAGVPLLHLAVKLGLPQVCGVLLDAGAPHNKAVEGVDAFAFAKNAARDARRSKDGKRFALGDRIDVCRLHIKFALDEPVEEIRAELERKMAKKQDNAKLKKRERAEAVKCKNLKELCDQLDPHSERVQRRKQVSLYWFWSDDDFTISSWDFPKSTVLQPAPLKASAAHIGDESTLNSIPEDTAVFGRSAPAETYAPTEHQDASAFPPAEAAKQADVSYPMHNPTDHDHSYYLPDPVINGQFAAAAAHMSTQHTFPGQMDRPSREFAFSADALRRYQTTSASESYLRSQARDGEPLQRRESGSIGDTPGLTLSPDGQSHPSGPSPYTPEPTSAPLYAQSRIEHLNATGPLDEDVRVALQELTAETDRRISTAFPPMEIGPNAEGEWLTSAPEHDQDAGMLSPAPLFTGHVAGLRRKFESTSAGSSSTPAVRTPCDDVLVQRVETRRMAALYEKAGRPRNEWLDCECDPPYARSWVRTLCRNIPPCPALQDVNAPCTPEM